MAALAATVLGLVLFGAMAAPAAAAPPAPRAVEVTLDQRQVSTLLGEKFTFQTRIANAGSEPTGRLIADLNVASRDSDVYVDLEDWSANRTHYLAPLAPGANTVVTFELQAVNAGSFNVYVVVSPQDGAGQLAASAPLRTDVAGRRALTAGGALPVVIAMPVLLGIVAIATRLRRRRTS
jgi:hypothetical protein